MRQFDLHPVEFKDGQVVEQDSIGALLLDKEGYEFEWDNPALTEQLEEKLEELLETPLHAIGPHPDPNVRATVRTPLEFGTAEWLSKLGDLLEGPNFRLRMRELA